MGEQSRLARYLALVWALVIGYACLYPFVGWHDSGVSVWAFLSAPWPRYFSVTDFWLNAVGFVPLGFLLAASMREFFVLRGLTVCVSVLLCVLFSGGMEMLQTFLPSRVASNLDLLSNAAGGCLGALLSLRWGRAFDPHGSLARWRKRRILPGRVGESGLLIIALWWLAQIEPTRTLFGTGDMRPLFDLPAPLAFSTERFVLLETLVVGVHLFAVSLLMHRVMRAPSAWLVGLVIVVALAVRSLANYLFMAPPNPWFWATPGVGRGLLAGTVLLVIAWRLPGWLQHSLACFALLIGTVLVNIMPQNPFDMLSVHLVQKSHFLNFHGLTQVVDFLWPLLAFFYLNANAALARRHKPGYISGYEHTQ